MLNTIVDQYEHRLKKEFLKVFHAEHGNNEEKYKVTCSLPVDEFADGRFDAFDGRAQ